MNGMKGYVLFCEDVRQEVGGQSSFIGVFTEVVNVEGFPHRLPRLWINVFLEEPASRRSKRIQIRIRFPNDADPIFHDVDLIAERRAFDENSERLEIERFRPQFRLAFAGVIVTHPGPIIVDGTIDGDEIDFGSIDVIQGAVVWSGERKD